MSVDLLLGRRFTRFKKRESFAHIAPILVRESLFKSETGLIGTRAKCPCFRSGARVPTCYHATGGHSHSICSPNDMPPI